MTPHELSIQLASDAENVCHILLPNGKKHGAEWCCGSVAGDEGSSLKVRLTGNKAGLWADFAANQKGDLIELYRITKNVSIRDAIVWAKQYLGVQDKFDALPRAKTPVCLPPLESKTLSVSVLEWFESRNIHPDTLALYQVVSNGPVIQFPYYVDGKLLMVKYRNVISPKEKSMYVSKDPTAVLFGWQAIPKHAREVVITEGECDALAYGQQGIPALSVPFGAGKGDKQKWIENDYDRLEQFDVIYLSMDMDAPGQETAPYLAERLGNHRCRLIELPCKDANDAIRDMCDLSEYVKKAKYCDPPDIKEASTFIEDVKKIFHQTEDEKGDTLPWRKTTQQFRLRRGETTLWSGINGHGKSMVLSHICASLINDGAKACIASMEMRPSMLLSKMFQQIGAIETPSDEYLMAINEWITEKIWLVNIQGTAKADRILELAEYAVRRFGITHYIIDSLAKCGFAEDDYNGQKHFIDRITDFAHKNNIHMHVVAHARKGEDEHKIAGKMDVKGTGALTDMVENVASVWRNKKKEEELQPDDNGCKPMASNVDTQPDCVIHVQKQRNFDWEGKIALWYDRKTHQYVERIDYKPHAYVNTASTAGQESDI